MSYKEELQGNNSELGAILEMINTLPENNAEELIGEHNVDENAHQDIREKIGEVGEKLEWVSNPNLLTNWYFGKPVNSRGQTEYTGAGYTIDRWWNNYCNMIVGDGYVQIQKDALTSSQAFRQFLDNYHQLIGKTLTFSVDCDIVTNGLFVTLQYIGYDSNNSPTYGVETKFYDTGRKVRSATIVVPDGFEKFCVNISLTGTATELTTVKLYAAKLELGTEQTLAHLENGKWVLNEVPNYHEEYLKCIQSTADASDTYANKAIVTKDELASMGEIPKIAVGTYTGDGTATRTIPLPFTPKAVIVTTANGEMGFYNSSGRQQSGGLAVTGGNATVVSITENGFIVKYRFDYQAKIWHYSNESGTSYRYLAIG